MTGAVAARLGCAIVGCCARDERGHRYLRRGTILDLATPEKLHQLSRGVEQVFVNGVEVIRDGRHAVATSGRALWRPFSDARSLAPLSRIEAVWESGLSDPGAIS